MFPSYIAWFCWVVSHVFGNSYEYSSIRFSDVFWEKKELHLYVYIECAYIYQNTSIVDNSCLFLAAQLKPFSMLPFRHILLFSI